MARFGTLAAGAAAVAMPYTIREPWAATPIKVGVISPLTGAWTVYGKAHFSGFELAVEEINKAGGVLGRPMEIVVGDSKTEPRRGGAGEPPRPAGAGRLPGRHLLKC